MRKMNLTRLISSLVIVVLFYVFMLFLLVQFESEHPDGTIHDIASAVWYTVVTVTTVGYGDTYPITESGRIIGLIFMISSIGLFGILIGQTTTIMTTIKENRMLGYNGTSFKNHTVIVGWNSFGRAVADQLVGVGKKLAIVTDNRNDAELIREIYSNKQVYILFSDFNNYEMLKKTNIEASNIIFINLNDDTEKLVYVLNLKKAFQNLQFVVTLDNGNLQNTFYSAGVTHTVSKQEIASKLLASYIFEPDVAAYSEDIMSFAHADDEHDIKQFKVLAHNKYLHMNYGEVFHQMKKDFNCILIGITKIEDGKKKLYKNPEDHIKVDEGDYLIIITNYKSLVTLKELFKVEEGYI